MEDNDTSKTDSSFDIIGFGKTAKAIPAEVYIETSRQLITTFSKIVSPICETTDGIGRYIKQKFDNMVDAEKAIGAYTIQEAIDKATQRGSIVQPKHLKSFINSFEESSKENDPLLHEMWANILASQLTDSNFHPRYVNILSSLSADEAHLLLRLNTVEEVGKNWSSYLGSPRDGFTHYVIKSDDEDLHEWTFSCNVLLEFELAEVAGLTERVPNNDAIALLYLTNSGKRFLDVVTME